MSDTVIQVENLGKLYKLGEVGTGTISHDIHRWWANVRGKEDPYAKVGELNDRTLKGGDYVWALRDIDFEVKQGEVLGIIGKNGAGKSTLLKILSKVTKPTVGNIKVKGRIASLLEVGTGFHPELTGRENIYLNGAILGMRKAEIKSKFDEIVDFSGVEKYIGTPVKRYSSGMYVRLAFAVAAFLEPEILIVDEVLAVGDAEFQKKCIGRMKDVSVNDGRTVLFVSHNMVAMKSLCNSGIFLQNGGLTKAGNISEIIHSYLHNKQTADSEGNIPEGSSTYYTGKARYTKIKILNHAGDGGSVFYNSPIRVYAEIESKEDMKEVILDLRISNAEGFQIVHAGNLYNEKVFASTSLKKGLNKIEVVVDNFLQPGRYSFTPGIHQKDGTSMDYVENILNFEVLRLGEANKPGYNFAWEMAMIRFNSEWKVNA
jgi:lipopolysaccharide transport system ATP-binding protein